MNLEGLLEVYERSNDEYYSSSDYKFNKFIEKEIEDIDKSLNQIQEN